LQDLDVDILKIDKSFVDALEYNNVTPHIIEIAKALKLEMVAEGIETENQETGYASTECSTVRAGFTAKRCRKRNLFCGQKNGFNMAVDVEMAGGTPHSQSSLFHNGRKSTVDHSLAIKWHRFTEFLHTGIGHHLLIRRVADLFGRVFNPAEYHFFMILRFHSHAKIGQFAVRDIICPALHHAQCTELLEKRSCFCRHRNVRLLVFSGYGNHKAINILHEKNLRSVLRGKPIPAASVEVKFSRQQAIAPQAYS
jgi:hypothetical protein